MIYSETVVKELNEKQINIAHNTTFLMDPRGSVIPVHVKFNLYYIRNITSWKAPVNMQSI